MATPSFTYMPTKKYCCLCCCCSEFYFFWLGAVITFRKLFGSFLKFIQFSFQYKKELFLVRQAAINFYIFLKIEIQTLVFARNFLCAAIFSKMSNQYCIH